MDIKFVDFEMLVLGFYKDNMFGGYNVIEV